MIICVAAAQFRARGVCAEGSQKQLAQAVILNEGRHGDRALEGLCIARAEDRISVACNMPLGCLLGGGRSNLSARD